jgi:hypothetical protein
MLVDVRAPLVADETENADERAEEYATASVSVAFFH